MDFRCRAFASHIKYWRTVFSQPLTGISVTHTLSHTLAADTALRLSPSLSADVLRAFADAAVQPGLPSDALVQVGHALSVLRERHGQQLQAFMGTLSEAQQQGMARLMHKQQ